MLTTVTTAKTSKASKGKADRLKVVSSAAPHVGMTNEQLYQSSRLLSMARNDTRLMIMCVIHNSSDKALHVSDIVREVNGDNLFEFPKTQASVSGHLRLLRLNGILNRKREGKCISYSLSKTGVKLMKFAKEMGEQNLMED